MSCILQIILQIIWWMFSPLIIEYCSLCVDLRHEVTSEGRSPLLAFCDGLMSSVLAYGTLPSEFLTTECIKVAFEENRLDLMSHWISQER